MTKDNYDESLVTMANGLLSNGLDRRKAMRLLLSSGVSAVVAGSVLTSAGASLASTPRKGGHAKVGVRAGSTSDSLDPATFVNVFMRTVGYGVCNNLAEIRGDGSIAPELLESWEAKPGASEWVFKVRKGVEFHNGKTLDADDVIASINHHRGEDSKSGMKAPLSSINEISKIDSHTIGFTLAQGNADFPYVFTDYRLMVMAAKDGKLDWASGNGTGGYKLENIEPGISAKLTRNGNFWKDDRAHFDSAEVITMPDVATRQTALINGDIDIVDQIDIKSVHLLKKSPGVEVADTAGALHYTYVMNTQLAPYDNNDLRLALKYGVDREALLQTVLRGYGTIGNDHPIAPIHQYHAADIEQRQYDPDKAKHHLKKAGHDSLDLSMSVSDAIYPGAVDGVTVYREQLAKAGINLDIVREAGDGYYSTVWMKKPWVASLWGARPTEDLILSTAYLDGAPWNDSFLKHEKLNKLIVAARSELDSSKRAEMYRDIQVILRDEGGTVIPLFANNVFAMSKKIGHPANMSGAWELDGGRSLERWWFA